MAATTTVLTFPASAVAVSSALPRVDRKRRINSEAGRALRTLAHAIEYMTDGFVHQDGALTAPSPQLEAVKLLMALNRRVYLECPMIPTFRERWLSLVRHTTL